MFCFPVKEARTILIYIFVSISSDPPVSGHHDEIRSARDVLEGMPGRDKGEETGRQAEALDCITYLIPLKREGKGKMIQLEEPKTTVPLPECLSEADGLPKLKVVY